MNFCTYLCTLANKYICTYMQIMYMHAYIQVCGYAYIYTCAWLCLCMYVHKYMYNRHTNMNIYI